MSSPQYGESSRGNSSSSSVIGNQPVPTYDEIFDGQELDLGFDHENENKRAELQDFNLNSDADHHGPAHATSPVPTEAPAVASKGKQRAGPDTTDEVHSSPPAITANKANEDAKRAKEQAESEAFARKFDAAQARGPLSVSDPEYQSLVEPFRKSQAEQAKNQKDRMARGESFGGPSEKKKPFFKRVLNKIGV